MRFFTVSILALFVAGCASHKDPVFSTDPALQPAHDASIGVSNETPHVYDEWIAVPDETAEVQTAEKSLTAQLREAATAALQQDQIPAALDYLNRAAQLGDGDAHYQLARLYVSDDRVIRDQDSAQWHLNASAGLGNVEATRVMGWQWIRGDNGKVDVAQGVSMLERAAERSPRAQRELGMLYTGQYRAAGVSDMVKGERYLLMASDAGDAEASYQLGKMMHARGDEGLGVERLRLAATAEHADAIALLSQIRGQDEPKAQTSPDGFYKRGMHLMANSQGSSIESLAKAYALLSLASDEGHGPAIAELALLGGVKATMDQRDPNWLEDYKRALQAPAE